MIQRVLLLTVLVLPLAAQHTGRFEYRVLATSKTSTMEKEMNEAAEAGYRFGGVMGGDTAVGAKEVVVVMMKEPGAKDGVKRSYRLLATSRTGTMQKELQQAGDEGYEYQGSTVFQSAFGGREVSAILEKDSATKSGRIEYKLLATSRTSTMQKEISEAGEQGYELCGVLVGKSAFGGAEVITILKKPAK
jgi:hypothetical protein